MCHDCRGIWQETFAEKFEEALAERRQAEPGYGLRTLARQLADGDPEKTKTILRRLQKYRPKARAWWRGRGRADRADTAGDRDALGLPTGRAEAGAARGGREQR
jgi:hypothetical protein